MSRSSWGKDEGAVTSQMKSRARSLHMVPVACMSGEKDGDMEALISVAVVGLGLEEELESQLEDGTGP